MVKPYTAVGLIPTVRGIRKPADIMINLEHLAHLDKAAAWLSSLDLPVRLIAFPEGALQGFNDEVLDLDHVKFARECAIEIPGEVIGQRHALRADRDRLQTLACSHQKPGAAIFEPVWAIFVFKSDKMIVRPRRGAKDRTWHRSAH